MNIKALKKIMLDYMKGDSFAYELAAVLGVSYSTAANRIAGRSKFRKAEIAVLQEHYKLTQRQTVEIFGGGAK